jgi:hypothetical protein
MITSIANPFHRDSSPVVADSQCHAAISAESIGDWHDRQFGSFAQEISAAG